MAETADQWRDRASGPSYRQRVTVTQRTKVQVAEEAYRELVVHRDECDGSCMAGVNCAEATRLQRAWRDVKNAVTADGR